MKTTTFLPLLLVFLTTSLFSQSNIQQPTSINADGAVPNASAMLDVQASDKGMLVPRMTSAQRTAIATPATGLLVFDTTTGGFWFYNGTAWTSLSGGGGNTPSFISDADGDTKVQTEETPFENVIRFDVGGTENMVLRKNDSGNPRLEMPNNLNNIFIGTNTGTANTTGANNTGIGVAVLQSNTTGNLNAAIGGFSLHANTTGSDNTANGIEALHFNMTGSANTASGRRALYSNSSGSNNTGIGYYCLSNSTGSHNTAFGVNALYSNTTGYSNVAIGKDALFHNTYPSNLVAIGDSALYNNTNYVPGPDSEPNPVNFGSIPENNVAVGSKALFTNSIGNNNTAVGTRALFSNNTSSGNTAIGSHSLENNVEGSSNTAIGNSALNNLEIGSSNIAIGTYTLSQDAIGNRNVAVGNSALSYFGDDNVALGHSAGSNSGSDYDRNVYLGAFAGSQTSGSGNVFIGYQTGLNADLSNRLYIDNSSTTTPLIWGDFSSNYLAVNGKLGIGTQAPNAPLHVKADGGFFPDVNGIYCYNPTNSANQHAIIAARVAGSSGGDPFLSFDANGEGGWSAGMDNSDANKFKISNSWDDLASATKFTIQTSGNVGIGTSAPTQALLVVSGGSNNTLSYGYLNSSGTTGTAAGTTGYSIFASARIAATEFNAFSDARIKRIIGQSNAEKDLEKLMQLKITDYTMIDTVAKGNKLHKKVIAQEVKEVYPQAVSTMTDVIPDIYRLSEMKAGFVFLENHTLKAGERVKLIFEDKDETVEVLEADGQGIKTNLEYTGKVFVFGREVDDFHVVDYEALSTLNISATQALFKRLTEQEENLQKLETENTKLKNQLDAQAANLDKINAALHAAGIGLEH